MLAATRLSELLGRAGPLDCRRIERTILSYLPKLRGRLRSVRANNIVDRIGGDKKAVGGRARFVLIEGIGRTVEVVAPPKSAVLAATGHALKLVRKSSRRSAA